MATLLITLIILGFIAYLNGLAKNTTKQAIEVAAIAVSDEGASTPTLAPADADIGLTLTAPKGGVWRACHIILDTTHQRLHVAGIPTPATDGTVARLKELGAEIVTVRKAPSLSLVSITSNLEVTRHLLQQFPASCKLEG